MNSNESSFSRPVEQRLRLNEFKELYKRLKRGNPVIDHLLLAALYWLEERFIDLKVESTVDEAIEEYKVVELSEAKHSTTPSGVPPPIYSEKDGEMRLTAPYFDKNF